MIPLPGLAPSDQASFEHRGLSDADFARFSALILERTGIKLTPSKRTHIEGKLRKRAATLGLGSVADYSRMLFEGGGLASELDILIHLATTNKTDFFRERAHFDILEKTILPALLKMRPKGATPRLKVWSAAASNGAEAFTIAMVLAEAARRGPRFDFAILGTDVSSEMIAEARRAIYPAVMTAPVPAPLQRRYFMRGRGSGNPTMVRVVPELRRRVRFSQVNLVAETLPVDRDVDVIFLRNVLIYFAPSTQKAVVRRLAEHLRPSGYLILGHTEATIGTRMGFEQIGTGVFRVT
ncbi:chemotaxis protein CheR [Rhodosalinus halophilus]|uniref:Chemotaxis protein methyltransferase n=1 Tax=Rhodosalinus halophilus TaxID=2259333 RepID=A0A365U3P9_9RHOB|nr:chemotaxis protein CheR [Rhodosalinus halophilus]